MVTVAQLDVLLRAPLSKLDSDLDKATDRFRSFGAGLTKVGAGLTARVTLPIVAIGGAALKVASDAQESENLFNVALGSMADQARRFSEEISDRLGISAFTIRENVGVLFQMTSAMGIAEDQALELATGMSELTQDLASFFNLRPEDAFRRLQSGIVGEIEPLRRLGILVDEQTAKQALLNKGLIKQGDELSQQQKVLGRYFAILEQTKNAQGDLERTSGDLANVVRRLGEKVKDTGIELGTLLVPAAEKALVALESMLDVVRNLVKGFSELPQGIQVTTGVLVGLAAATGPVLLGLGQIAALLADLTIAIKLGAFTFLRGAVLAAAAAFLSPAGLIAALAVAAAGIAVYVLATQDARTSTQRFADELQKLNTAAQSFTQFQVLAAIVELEKRQDEFLARARAIRAEIDAQPQILGQTPNVQGLRDELADLARQANLAQDSIDRLQEIFNRLTVPELPPIAPSTEGVDTATARLRGMTDILREAAREVGLLDERARAFGPAFDVARERVAILEGALDDLFRLDQTPEVLAAIDSIAAQLAQAQLAVEAFELPPLTLNIEVPDFALDFRDIGREAATTFVSSFSRGIGSLTDKLLSVFGRIFDRIAGDFIAKLISGIGSVGGGGPLAAIPLVGTLEKLLPFDVAPRIDVVASVQPELDALPAIEPVSVSVQPQLSALPDLAPVTVELTPQLAQVADSQVPAFAQAGVGSVAVAPAAQFQRFPVEELQPFSVAAVAADPTFQRLIRQSIIVAEDDGF